MACSESRQDFRVNGVGWHTLIGQRHFDTNRNPKRKRGKHLRELPRLRVGLRFPGTFHLCGAVQLVKLSISQITDDAVDQLFGGGDTDWYLTNTASEVKGATRDESIN